ncbi:SusC/RagA family TonB-linked outer membrane protein [Pedobacter sp. FW305-3-2-15-E-R2A2]|uniref:SusC/RagA family TonB-linked outer membrane protein n=1 Tax=Pedobacter sp. FW305-3-2-15-E-R2A2 TaxID=3140251 RepID=UPI0031408E27
MRANLTTVLLISAIIQVSASSFAQKITLSERNAPLLKVFREIRVQTGYDFMVTATTLKGTKDITIEVKNAELNDVLKNIFEGQPLKYFVNDQTIIVSEKDGTVQGGSVRLPDITISGKVVDEKGIGLPGATIRLKGRESKVSVVTSTDGQFSIVIPGERAVLIISYVGFKTKEVKVSGADVDLIVRMERVTGVLEEVTVVSTGYQSVPKERATGSFEKINNALLNRNTGSNLLSRLENVTPGMLIDRRLNPSRAPGIGNVTIRGQSTLTGSIAKPLIILDNFPYEGELDNINPNDIENVTILKDAAAASIWGARAANGVIVINTKKGNYNSSPDISFNTNFTIQNKPDLFALKPMSTSDYIDLEKRLFNEGFYDNKILDVYSWPYLSPVVELMLKARAPGATLSQAEADAQIDALRKYDARNDYLKYVYRADIAQQYAINIKGGGDQFNYLLSGGYDNNRFNVVKNNADRITLRTNIGYKPIKNLEFETSILYTQKNAESPGLPSVLNYDPGSTLPYTRLADDNGNPLVVGRDYGVRFLDSADPRYLDWRYRPLAELNTTSNIINTYDWLMNIAATYKFPKIFSTSIKYQYGKTLTEGKNLNGKDSYYTRNQINLLTELDSAQVKYNLPIGGILNQTSGNTNFYNIRGQVNANKNWNDKHELDALAGVEKSERHIKSNTFNTYGYNDELLTYADVDHLTQFLSPVFTYVNMPSGIDFTDQRIRFTSIFANAAYTYNKRYTVSASGRKDAANLFGVKANLRGAPFWSAGLSWNVSDEPFYHFALLPYLKFRATYGYQGNTDNNLSAYSSIRYSGVVNEFNLPYAILVNPANDNLRWERVGTFNFGLDFRSKNNVIFGSIEYYSKRSKDMLYVTPLDFTTGFNSATYNSSDMKGRGVDISLHLNNLQGNIKWNTDLFFNYNTNRITRFQPSDSGIDGYIGDGLTINSSLVVGKPSNAVFSYQWAGLDPETGDPLGYLNGEKSKDYALLTNVSPDQLQYHGSAVPVYSGGLRNTLSYKNISLSVNVIAKLGYVFRRPGLDYSSILDATSSGVTVGHADYSKRWQKPGDEIFTDVPSLAYPNDPLRNTFYQRSAALVEKADHIRLQDITLSYLLDNVRWPVRNIKIFTNLSNLGVIWKANKLGLDPEYYKGYPAPLTTAFGLSANF